MVSSNATTKGHGIGVQRDLFADAHDLAEENVTITWLPITTRSLEQKQGKSSVALHHRRRPADDLGCRLAEGPVERGDIGVVAGTGDR